jgi:hypothetical protein
MMAVTGRKKKKSDTWLSNTLFGGISMDLGLIMGYGPILTGYYSHPLF